MDRYMGIFATSGAVQEAVNNDSLHKPYIAIVQDGNYLDWNTLGQVPSLPDKPFLFNYTAKRYDEPTGQFVKEDGQLYDNNIGMGTGKTNIIASNDYVEFVGDAYYEKGYTSVDSNPFNRTSADCNFTFIYKTSGFTGSGNRKIFSNRRVGSSSYQSKYDCHNYIISSDVVFGFEGTFAPINNPQYVVIRAFDDNSGLRQEVDAHGNTIQSAATQFVEWDAPSAGVGFFTGGYNYNGWGTENFRGKFYWMYCANQTLTDEEVLQVIKHNDNLGGN